MTSMHPPATRYSGKMTVREGRERYFEVGGFGTETYTERWVKLPLGPLHFYLPNPGPRRVCVPLHDIDHVVTSYAPDWHGEFQISGFEIGAGCGRYWFGWMVNSQGIAGGALRWPRDTLRAFVRGRRCAASIFDRDGVDDALLDTRISELRARIGLDHDISPVTWSERGAFVSAVALALVVNTSPLIAAAIWWALR